MLLAIDTSTKTIGLALYQEDNLIYEAVWRSENYHTTQLAPSIQTAVEQADLTFDDLEAVAVAIGPGSFTGLRIGMALAKGLALARRIPIIGVPSLDVVAASHPLQDIPLAAVLQAGRDRLAVDWYIVEKKAWKARNELEVLTPDVLNERLTTPTIVCGELNATERQAVRRNNRKNALVASPAWSVRRPAILAEIAWNRWQKGQMDDPIALAPIYLHHGDPIAS